MPDTPAPKFDPSRLDRLAYARGFTLWRYRPDRCSDVLAPCFFGPWGWEDRPLTGTEGWLGRRDGIRAGDRIMVTALDGTTDLYVTEAREDFVTVAVVATLVVAVVPSRYALPR